MSAKFDAKRDKNYLLSVARPSMLDEMEKAFLMSSFDEETSQDIARIEKELIHAKFLKRVCIIKLLLFIPEYALISLLLHPKFRKGKLTIAKLYYRFLFNKVSFEQFNLELTNLLKDGIIT